MRWFAVFLCTIVLAISSGAAAQQRYDIDVPAGRLDQSLNILSRQTDTNVGGVDPEIGRATSRRVRGRLTVEQALGRILADTPFTYRKLRGAYRIIKRPKAAPGTRQNARRARPRVPSPGPVAPPKPIIVTATKLDTRLADYAGTVHLNDIKAASSGTATSGIESLAASLPTVAQTHLGAGRNKLFVRGIADSSFNGPTQSTLALYQNDIRLTYSAPNPDLRLYDTNAVEIIEGPQGSLYGAGAIGGILRTVTNPADPESTSGTVWLGGGGTSNGDVDYNIAGVINAPVSDGAAVRVLAYHQQEGGWIDDTLRGLKNINSTQIDGGRVSLHWSPEETWAFDFVASHQSLRSDDSQYTDQANGSLSRSSNVAQPFRNDHSLYSLTLRKRLSNFNVISATGYVTNTLSSRFDATPNEAGAQVTIFDERRDIALLSHETRVTSTHGDLTWLAGLSYLSQKDEVEQFFGRVDDAARNAVNVTDLVEYAAFGEANLALGKHWTVSLGGRAVLGRIITEQSLIPDIDLEPKSSTTKFLPSASVRWSPKGDGSAHLRYQEGYRVGGITISSDAEPRAERFEEDQVETIELGIEYPIGSDDRMRITHSFFYTRWQDVQADVVDLNGFPVTANIGDGNVYGISLTANWQPFDKVDLQVSAFANESEIVDFDDDIAPVDDTQLPNIAKLGAQGRIGFIQPLANDRTLRASFDGKYVGSSTIGIDEFLSMEQGDYVVVGGQIELVSKNWAVDLTVNNVLGRNANRFALGNPFQIATTPQFTPLRPMSLRVSVRADF